MPGARGYSHFAYWKFPGGENAGMYALRKSSLVCCLLLFQSLCWSDEVDPVQAELDKAKASYESAIETSESKLLDAFDTKIAAVAATGSLAGVRLLLAEKDAFLKEGKVPLSPTMREAVSEYYREVRKARDALELAYGKAIREYTKSLQIEKADSIESELAAFKEMHRSAVAADARPRIEIIAAFYGQNVSWIDVTDKVRAAVGRAALWSTVVRTSDWGEPAPGWTGTRSLLVRYSVNGKVMFKAVWQGEVITIP
ncbi:MAG: hypothetical protein KatS3mg110_0882 [Pirellulaceae bacterium]|nr:MAG: hypothetical protein KatS3mg110_0882 [Pirellulaceae bacterium]